MHKKALKLRNGSSKIFNYKSYFYFCYRNDLINVNYYL